MDDKQRLESYERAHDPARVLALSDGVFAIIITLLVLEIHVPDLAKGQSLADAGREIRPSIIAFLISFVVVAISWAGHRDLFSLIRRTDRYLVWLNLLYLLPLSVVPFGASLISRYDKDPIALRMYGFLLVVVAVTRLIIWWYATGRSHLLYAPVDARSRWAGTLVVVVPAAVYIVAILIADSNPRASLVIYAAIPILYFVGITLARTTAPPDSAERDFT
jgi:TMEM175 potassium channel family protein